MPNWLCGRESVKRAVRAAGPDKDSQVDRLIEAASLGIERATRRYFIPRTETRLYRWPQRRPGLSYVLELDQDLISATSVKTKAQDASPTTIAAGDYFLEPANMGPPYNRIEIDLSSTAALEAGDTPQRSISVAGSWGSGNVTQAAGTVSSGLAADSTATSMMCSNGSLIEVGDTLLVESEQLFISNRATISISQLLDGALTATKSQTSVTVDSGAAFNAGEQIAVDSERMYVESVTGNELTVVRAYDGSTLAAHADNAAVLVYRTLTIERGVNGTAGATHTDGTAISRYRPPQDVAQLCLAEAVAAYHQEGAGWGREVGPGEAGGALDGRELSRLRKSVLARFARAREAAV